MTRSAAIAVLTEQEAEARLISAGYRKVPCTACRATGHFTIVANDARDWKKYVCESCGGATFQFIPP